LLDPAAREDLFQEIALAVWIGIPGFRGEASERTWLYRIAHNTASTQLHKFRQRRERERQPIDADPEPAAVATPEPDLHHADQRDRFFAALRQLPTIDFQIVTMHLAGLSYTEIADVAGLTQTNVGARLSRVRKALASQLGTAEAKP
jgi:RNA polymerase sigma-70 factor (ECF subfamily)